MKAKIGNIEFEMNPGEVKDFLKNFKEEPEKVPEPRNIVAEPVKHRVRGPYNKMGRYDKHWTVAEDDIIRTSSIKKAMRLLKRSSHAIYCRRKTLGVAKMVASRKPHKGHRVTPQEIEIIKSHSAVEARKLLPYRSKAFIYRYKKFGKTIPQMKEKIELSFLDEDQARSAVDMVGFAAKSRNSISAKDLVEFFGLKDTEAVVLIKDIFQQVSKILSRFNITRNATFKDSTIIVFG